jgi:hypothetical protein
MNSQRVIDLKAAAANAAISLLDFGGCYEIAS